MPDKTACPRCKKVGFVRFEHVVKGGESYKACFCGACEYAWELIEASAPAGSDDTGLPERPDRSRP